MGFKLAEAYVEIAPKGFAAVAAAIDDIKTRLNSSAASANLFGGALQSGIGNLASVAITRLSSGLFDTAKNMLRLSAAAEDSAIGFRVLLGSAEKAQALLSQLQEYANRTPLGFADMQRAAETMLQFGVAGDQIMPVLKMLGDVSGGNAQKFSHLALVYGQVSSAGKLMGQDLLQLINSGFNPLQEMVRTTGKDYGELRAAMERGQISISDVTKAFQTATSAGGRYHGMMEERGKSLVGLWGRITDDLARMQKQIGDGFVTAFGVRDVAKNTETGLNAVAKAMERNKAEVSALIRGGVTFAGVMTGLTAGTWALSTAMRGAAAAGITMNVVLNPANIAKVGVSLAAAAIAIGVMDHNLSQAGVSLGNVKEGMDGVSTSAGRMQDALLGNGRAVEVTHAKLLALRERLEDLRQLRADGSISQETHDKFARQAVTHAGLDRFAKPGAVDNKLAEIEKLKASLAMLESKESDAPGIETRKEGIRQQIAELSGSAAKIAQARAQLRRALHGDIGATILDMRDNRAAPEAIDEAKRLLEAADAVEKRNQGTKAGESFLSQLLRDKEALEKGWGPVEQQLERLRSQNVGDAQLSVIGKLLRAKEKLETRAKDKTFLQGLADDADQAAGRIDSIQARLRDMARAGSDEESMAKAAELLMQKRESEKASKAAGPQFIGTADLNKTMQAAVGRPDVQEQQLSVQQRILEALQTAGRTPEGTRDGRNGGAGGGLFGGLMRGMEFPQPNLAGLIGGAGNNAAARQGDMLGAVVDRLDRLIARTLEQTRVVEQFPRSLPAVVS